MRESYEEFTFDADIPDDKFTIPEEKKQRVASARRRITPRVPV